MAGKILVVGDDQQTRTVLSRLLREEGYEAQTVSGGSTWAEALEEDAWDVVLCDVKMTNGNGPDLVEVVQKHAPDTPVVIVASYANIKMAVEAIMWGAETLVLQPFEPEQVLLAVEKALERRRLVRENRLLRRGVQCDCSCLIGVSPVLREICQIVGKVASTRSPVLIVGESGTGKELIARSVHYNSPRRERPMVTVNCGAIPPDLLESELFGHTKGAFTGAVSAKQGLLEEGDGSTLFLDEVGELSLDMQVKILRVVENGELRRLGDNRTIELDLRIVAATNRDLEAEVRAGRFRADLYYRLNVVCIRVPPLRERREDIPVLARHFQEKYARIYGRKVDGISDAAMKVLMSRAWQGNVRELEHVIERAVVLGNGRIVQPRDLPFAEEEEAVQVIIPQQRMNLKETLKEVVHLTEQEMVCRALRHTYNNHSRASQMLGISRRALLYKLKQDGGCPVEEPVGHNVCMTEAPVCEKACAPIRVCDFNGLKMDLRRRYP